MMFYPENQPFKIIQLEEINSTSSYLRMMCESEKLEEFTTIVAKHQSAGRGQRGNSWESEAGKNLLFSFVLHPLFLQARNQFLLSQIVSLAIKEELDTYATDFSIKWPNDIYWNEKKICGILIENDLYGENIGQSIAGIGINLNQSTFISNAPNPVSLNQITGEEYEIPEILNNILIRVREYYKMLKENDISTINDHYKNSIFRKEGFHRYMDTNGEFIAEITDIETDGKLILNDENGDMRSYAFKEVQFLL